LLMKPVIHSVKHYVQFTNLVVDTGVLSTNVLIQAIANTADPATTADVVEGAVVKAIYIEFWLKGIGASDANTQFELVLFKNPAGNSDMTITNMANLMAYPNKKNILFTSQGVLSGLGAGQSVPVIRQWVKIPKTKQRFGLDDQLIVMILPLGTNIQRCGLVTFKEYT